MVAAGDGRIHRRRAGVAGGSRARREALVRDTVFGLAGLTRKAVIRVRARSAGAVVEYRTFRIHSFGAGSSRARVGGVADVNARAGMRSAHAHARHAITAGDRTGCVASVGPLSGTRGDALPRLTVRRGAGLPRWAIVRDVARRGRAGIAAPGGGPRKGARNHGLPRGGHCPAV